MATFDEIKALKKRHSAALLTKRGVCGVDVHTDADGQAILTVHLDTDDQVVRQQLPSELEGYPLRFVHTGPFRKE